MAAITSGFQMTMGPSPSFNSGCADMSGNPYFDFEAGSQPEPHVKPSPSESDRVAYTPPSPSMMLTASDTKEECQTPSKPTFPYDDHKQTTGLPSNSIPGLGPDAALYSVPFSNTGLDEANLMEDYGWNSMDTTFFDPIGYVDPASITYRQEKMRVYPGMHSQAAEALQRKQQQQQQQLQLQQQQQQRQQPNRPHPTAKRPSGQLPGDHNEEVISRLLSQMRHGRQASNHSLKSDRDHATPLHHIVRSRKEEEEMDEDERLLASEAGKKLSSKERRQLRNKVSARAFRSRRKEYITQLENDVTHLTQLLHEEKMARKKDVQELNQENASLLAFVDKMLHHPEFLPRVPEMVEEFSELVATRTRIATASGFPPPPLASQTYTPPPRANPMSAPQNGPQSMPGNPMNYHVGATLVPEMPFAMSQLSVNSSYSEPWGGQSNMGGHFQVYSIHELPEGPSAPMNTESLSGKGHSSFFSQDSPIEEVKLDYPVVEPVQPEENRTEGKDITEEVTEDDDDPEFDLYRSSVSVFPTSTPSATANLERVPPESAKASAHFELVVCDEAENQRLMERFERMCAMVEPVYQRIAAMTVHLDS
jgi:hypothetical protein